MQRLMDGTERGDSREEMSQVAAMGQSSGQFPRLSKVKTEQHSCPLLYPAKRDLASQQPSERAQRERSSGNKKEFTA